MRKILLSLFAIAYCFGEVENMEFIAKEVHKNGDIVEASGDVLVYSKSYLISAQKAKYDQKNEIVELFDDVNVIRNNEETTNSNYAKIYLKTNEIITDNAFAMHQSKELWIDSQSFCSNEKSIDTNKSIVSSCNVDNPDWHIEYSSGQLDKENKYLHIFNPVFYGNLPFIGQTPLLYLPYFGFSTDRTRRTGFLTPSIGFSKGEGLYFEQPFYIAEYNNWDLELNPQIRTKRGFGFYATLRFADSPYSRGFIRAGFFKDKNSYAEKNLLKNNRHQGVEIGYESDRLVKRLIDGNYGEGLYLDFTHLNDVDYLNMQNGKSNTTYDSLIHSKLNYFLNTKEHYFGLYGDYYINTAKIATKYGNKDTIQELPSLQYHSYLDTFLSKNFTYALDIQYHNYTRSVGVKAQQFELNLPVGINYTSPDGWLNFSWTNNLYLTHINYSKNYTDPLRLNTKNRDHYARHWQEFTLSTDLAKAYDSGIFHTINLGVSFIQPGYKSGDIVDYLYAYDKLEPEENFIEQIDEKYRRQNIRASFVQYFFNEKNEKFLRHSLESVYLPENSRLDITQNRIDLYYGNINLFSKIEYNHHRNNFTSAKHGININYKNAIFDLRHYYNKIYKEDDSIQKSNYLQAYAAYTFDNFIRVFGAYAYDFEAKYTKMWQIGISQNRKCWNYGIYFNHNTEPVNTSAGPESKHKNSVMLFFAFYPFGDFNYDVSIKSQDNL